MRYQDLKNILAEYNWEDGFDVPMKLLNDPNCDLALALDMSQLKSVLKYL